jgi:two-component system, response regulator YesN
MMDIMIVDDDSGFREILAETLAAFLPDCRIFVAKDGNDAMETLKGRKLHYVITDIHMPLMDGYELISNLRREYPDVAVCAMSGELTDDTVRRLESLGVTRCLRKPFSLRQFAANLRTDFVPKTHFTSRAPDEVTN